MPIVLHSPCGEMNISNQKTNVYYKNWIESRFIFVKDLIEHDGSFISEHNVLQKLKHKTNWVGEFFQLKNVFTQNVLKNCDTIYAM